MGAKTTRYHVTIDLVGGLRLRDWELDGIIIDDNGRRLTCHEARKLFVQKLREGFDVLPVCDKTDDKGHCLGHPAEGD